MEKQTINVPGVEGFAQPRTRRDFFKTLAVAGAAGVAGAGLFTSKKASAQIGGTQEGDAGILNFALVLELLEAEFYTMAVDSGVLSGNALASIRQLRDTEVTHVNFLTSGLQSVGATPAPKPTFTFPSDAFASQSNILNLAATFEPVGVGAYIGAAPMIQNPAFLEAAGTIAGVEGDHVTAIRNLLGIVPPAAEAFAEALTKDQVLAAVAPFLGMGAMPATGGPGAE